MEKAVVHAIASSSFERSIKDEARRLGHVYCARERMLLRYATYVLKNAMANTLQDCSCVLAITVGRREGAAH